MVRDTTVPMWLGYDVSDELGGRSFLQKGLGNVSFRGFIRVSRALLSSLFLGLLGHFFDFGSSNRDVLTFAFPLAGNGDGDFVTRANVLVKSFGDVVVLQEKHLLDFFAGLVLAIDL